MQRGLINKKGNFFTKKKLENFKSGSFKDFQRVKFGIKNGSDIVFGIDRWGVGKRGSTHSGIRVGMVGEGLLGWWFS